MLSHLSVADWPDDLAPMTTGFAGRLNVYGVMAHHPALLRAWAGFRDHVVLGNVLGPAFSEVVILRTGVRLGARYEWDHHVVRGRKAGLDDARILALRGPLDRIAGDDRLLATAVDQLFDRKGLDPATHTALEALVGAAGVLDVMATVAHYSLLGYMLNSVEVPLDRDIAAALAAAPLDETG